MNKKTKIHSWCLLFDRTFSGNIWKQIIILLGVALIALMLGLIVCYLLPFGNQGSRLPFYEWALYLFIDGNALSNLYMDDYLNGDRFWVILFAVLGSFLGIVIFGGMLVSVLSNMLERRIENYRQGKNIYVISGHYIILGYDEIVPSIIKQLCTAHPSAYVLLQSSLPSEIISEKLHSSIAQDFEKRVIVKNGHRTSIDDLCELKLSSSQEIFIVGDRSKSSHDAMNIDCLEKIRNIIKEKNNYPSCITTVFEDPDTFAALQVVDLFEEIRNLGVELKPYNFYSDWARKIFVDCEYIDDTEHFSYPHIDKKGIADNDDVYVHLVIVGMSNFGTTLGVEAAKILHFPNFHKNQNLTRITFIDIDVKQTRNVFLTRYRHFFEIQSHKYNEQNVPATRFKGNNADFLDVEFEFIEGDIFSLEIQSLLSKWAIDGKQYLSLIFAMSDLRLNMAIALNLPDELYENATPIFVRQKSSSKFLNLLHEKSNCERTKIKIEKKVVIRKRLKGKFAQIYPFGMADIIFDENKRSLKVAEYINFLYAKCEENNWNIPNPEDFKKCSWDEVHMAWKNLPVAHQWSNLYCAYNIEYRIRSIMLMREKEGIIINSTDYLGEIQEREIEVLGRVEHNRWNVEKLMLGYRKPTESEDYYSDINIIDGKKNKELKNAHKELYIHSDIRPYEELDDIQEIDKEIIRHIPWFQEKSKS